MKYRILSAVLLTWVAPAIADEDRPTAVPATRNEVKTTLEGSKKSTPRLPFPEPVKGDPFSKVNNGLMHQHLPAELRQFALGWREKDPKMSVDPTYKVMLFWVTSRINNCVYCLGHQEQKLAAAGLTDDQIAALDGDWAEFNAAQKAGLELTKLVGYTPHLIGAETLNEVLKHYKPEQVLEILLSIGGFNAMNRWTGSLNIPAEADGNFFAKENPKVDLSTFLKPTSEKWRDFPTCVAPVPGGKIGPAVVARRPALESRESVEKIWAANFKPSLPLTDDATARAVLGDLAPKEGTVPAWMRLLAHFPVEGKGRVTAYTNTANLGEIPARLKAAISWTAAREDRAWYALSDAKARLNKLGLTDDDVFALDEGKGLSDAEKDVLAFTRKLTSAPASMTDADFARLRKHYEVKAIAEIVQRVCTAALFDRITSAAQLPLDTK